jgi:glyoxylase-like metal-dependent hydrolase (beta-lactamase superfamily II)
LLITVTSGSSNRRNTMDRRTFLATTAATTAAALAPLSAFAAAPMLGTQAPGFFRFKVGEFEVTSLHDGTVTGDFAPERFPNAKPEEVLALMESQYISTKPVVNTFNTMVVNTGSKLVLIDSGFANNGAPTTGRLAANLAAAGIDPKNIDTVLISHYHGDHINGLRSKEGELVYANAEIIVPPADHAHFMDEAKMNAVPEAARGSFKAAQRVFTPIAKDLKMGEWGKEWAPGITAIQADGHSPGHTSFVVSSGSKTLLVIGDASNDPRIFARMPDWHFGFDFDKPKAVETRKKLLDMAAADRMQVSFYHAAFPSTGHVAKNATGYDWYPISYRDVL